MRRIPLGELARLLDGQLQGDPAQVVEGIRPLSEAGPKDVSFLANPRYRQAMEESRAGAVIVARDVTAEGRSLVRVRDPYVAFAIAIEAFHGEPYAGGGVSPQASVAPGAHVGADPTVGPFAVVCEGARLGDRVTVMAGAYVGPGARVGDDTVLHPNVVLEKGVVVGRRCIIHAGTVLGSDGFGFAREGKRYRKILQVGIVRVGDDVEIGANCTVDRAAMGETVIEDGCKLDNLVHVAHNVRLGRDCVLAGQTGISGSTTLEEGVAMAGQTGVAGHLTVGAGAAVLAKSAVLKDVPAGAQVAGIPAVEAAKWRRAAAAIGKLDDLRRRILRLERRLGTPPEDTTERE